MFISDKQRSQPLVESPGKKHADRLVKRIGTLVDELYMVYKIGVELELMLQDDEMSAQLKGLRGKLSKLPMGSP